MSRLVSRATSALEPSQVRAAALRSLSENLGDSVVAPPAAGDTPAALTVVRRCVVAAGVLAAGLAWAVGRGGPR